MNHKKIQRLWREEGLRVPQRRRRNRHGTSTAPPTVTADAPNRVWAVDFQFDVTTDGRPIKIVSIVDEHTREGTVTLIGMSSGAVSFGAAAMDQLWGVDISGGSVERGNLTPDREAIGHHLSVVGRRQQVPTDPEMWRNAAERRQEPLGMPG